jgi:hypothetical protein
MRESLVRKSLFPLAMVASATLGALVAAGIPPAYHALKKWENERKCVAYVHVADRDIRSATVSAGPNNWQSMTGMNKATFYFRGQSPGKTQFDVEIEYKNRSVKKYVEEFSLSNCK